jgi:hypothetical protein
MTPYPIPSHWTPDQALAVYEFLSQLRDQLWQHYQLSIREHIGALEALALSPSATGSSSQQLDLFDDTDLSGFDTDDFPF